MTTLERVGIGFAGKELPIGEFYDVGATRIRRIVRYPKILGREREPVILLHGFAASSFSFREMQPALSQSAVTHALDLPGMGYSARPRDEYSLSFYVDFVRRYLDQEDLDRVHLVGHSLGAAIVLLFALTYPDRLRKMTVVAPLVNFHRVQSGYLGKAIHVLGTPVLGHSIMAFHGKWFAKIFLNRIMAEHHLITEEFIHGYFHPWTFDESSEGLMRVNRMLLKQENHAIAARLHEISHPTLILWGEKDPLIPVEDAALLRKIAHAEVEIYPGAGHMLMHERAHDLNERVGRFLFDI